MKPSRRKWNAPRVSTKHFSPFGVEAMKLSARFTDEEVVKIARAAKLCSSTISEYIWLVVVSGTAKVLYEENRSKGKKDGTDTTANQRDVV